jgi:hypothetical protein
MMNRGKFKGLQSGITQNLLIIAFALCAVAAVVFAGCQNGAGESDISPQIPVAKIKKDGKEPVAGVDIYGLYQFELTGRSYTGAVNSDDNIEALKDAYDKWLEYETFVDPRPFYPPKTGKLDKNFDAWLQVGSDYKLKNLPSMAPLVIQRYWTSAWGDLTTASWTEHNTNRATEFRAAKSKIETLMATIKKSDFYEVSYTEGATTVYPLKNLVTKMQDFIKTPTTGLYTDYGPWTSVDLDAGKTKLHSGALYELYFGHIPAKGEYYDPAGELVYPDDTTS